MAQYAALPQKQDLHLDTTAPGRGRTSCDGKSEAGSSQSTSLSHRTTISFDPLATTDEGKKRALETPPRKLPLSERTRGRSMMQELAESASSRSRTRTHSESDRSNYDPSPGHPSSAFSQNNATYEWGESRWPLLQSTVDLLAQEQERSESQDPASDPAKPTLSQSSGTSNSPQVDSAAVAGSTSSAVSDLTLSPDSASFPSLTEAESLSSPVRRSVSRNAANHGERPSAGSLRRLSRRASTRSTSSSTKSPASQFLSRWSRDSSVSRAEPDDDGQTIGNNNEYVIGAQVGFGGFSVVKEVYSIENGVSVVRAVKIVRKQVLGKSEEDNEKLQMDFEHEVSVWRHLKHEHVLPLVSVFESPFATFCIIPMNTGGTLFDLVRSRRRSASTSKNTRSSSVSAQTEPADSPPMTDAGIPVPVVQHYLGQLASAVRYLHQDMKIVHRDIKLENCLVTDPNTSPEAGQLGNILLCDFGMADFMVNDDADDDVFSNAYDGNVEQFEESDAPHNIGPSETSTNVAGSLQYASPELIKASRPLLVPPVDIWAIGVLTYALLTAELPFNHPLSPRLAMLILKGEWSEATLQHAAHKSSEGSPEPASIISLVEGCLKMDVTKRWSIQQVLDSDFLKGA